jgi:hypothetical protein
MKVAVIERAAREDNKGEGDVFKTFRPSDAWPRQDPWVGWMSIHESASAGPGRGGVTYIVTRLA